MVKSEKIKNKMVDETEVKVLKQFTFPRDEIVIEAETIEEAIEKKNLLLNNNEK